MSRWWVWAALAALVYAILLGATGLGELHPVLRALNGVVAGAVIVAYLVLAPRRADRIDTLCLAALLVFLASALLSAFPRQSLDSALGALTWTAAFFLARILLADADARRWLIRDLIGLSVVLTVVAAARWLPPTLEWWSITGVTPPLDMNRSGVLWGHRHDLALVVAVLYPAWWVGSRSPLRTAAAIVFGVLAAVVVFVDGSRTNWLALVLAGLVVAAPAVLRRWNPDRRTVAVGAGVAGFALVVGVVVGVIPAAMDRLLTTNTFVSRADMWGALLQVWGERPMNGYGPGSFVWLLQMTDYFDANSWAPRHPDSLPFQVLPEAGLLGVVAIGIVVVALARGVWRAHWAPRFALLAMALAAIGANPTEFGFFVLVGVAWAAYAVPNSGSPVAVTARWPRVASLAAVGVIGVAFTATALAAFAHEAGRRAIVSGNFAEATAQLRMAEGLDPGLALYPRLLGAALFLTGEQTAAEDALERAIARSPTDDLAWRTLALVQAEGTDPAVALDSIDRAVQLHRADATNLLLRSSLELQNGLADRTVATSGEILHAWPWLTSFDGWADAAGVSGDEALAAAVERAERGDPAPQSNALHAIWVAALAGRDDLLADAVAASGLTRSLGEAYAAAVLCDPDTEAYLDGASDADRRFDEYWALRVRDANAAGAPDADAQRAWEIMTGLSLDEPIEPLNPFDENGFAGLSADTWGYRRPPVSWPDLIALLPSPDDAYRRWLVDPSAAAAASGLSALEGCP